VSGLAEQLDVYRSATYICPINSIYSFQCGSMLLGALTKETDSSGLLSTRLQRLYLGQTFDALCVKTRLMQSGTWSHSHYSPHSCDVSTAVSSIVDQAVANVAGLTFRRMERQKKNYASG
jgi:hypothetical protein